MATLLQDLDKISKLIERSKLLDKAEKESRSAEADELYSILSRFHDIHEGLYAGLYYLGEGLNDNKDFRREIAIALDKATDNFHRGISDIGKGIEILYKIK